MKDVIDELKKDVQVTLRESPNLSRRSFFQITGTYTGGFTLVSLFPQIGTAEEPSDSLIVSGELNAFIRVSASGKITIYSANAEMGQGIKTALPMIVAEEMGADWEDVEVVQSEVDEDRFGRQSAGGSTTITRTWDQMRQMGASAREMFISAGALVMEVPREELNALESKVVHGSGRFRTFGELASLAAKQDIPPVDTLVFKERQDYTIIGKAISGVDNLAITTGLALFGIDTQVPNLLHASYTKCPAIGGTVIKANLEDIKKLPGVIDAFIVRGNGDVTELLDGVAIVGNTTFSVFDAKRQLEIEWDETTASKDSWSQMVSRAKELHRQRGVESIVDKGDVNAAFEAVDNKSVEAFYEYPFVAHLCMEPMNCSAHYKKSGNGGKDTLELWIPTQMPARAYSVTRSMFGLDDEQVTIHQMRLGGSFGRRIFNEYTCEAIAISKRMNGPIKLTWTREDDVRHDFYRVGGFQSIKGAVNQKGSLVALQNHYIGMQKDGRPVIGSGFSAREFPIASVPNVDVTSTLFDLATPCGPWRAPRSNTNAFVMQSFLDELAYAAGRDYLEFLLELMGEPRWLDDGNLRSLNTGRAAGVIRLAAEKAGWGRTMPEGTGLGLAFYFSHAGHIAEVAEVEVSSDRRLEVKRVTVAVDVGPIINMSGATSQVEGAVIDGLSTMMGQKITMENGRIEQSNLHDYPVLRLPSAPKVDSYFIQSDFRPTGLGEPCLPPLAPAVGNAIFAATGERVRTMPLTDLGYRV